MSSARFYGPFSFVCCFLQVDVAAVVVAPRKRRERRVTKQIRRRRRRGRSFRFMKYCRFKLPSFISSSLSVTAFWLAAYFYRL